MQERRRGTLKLGILFRLLFLDLISAALLQAHEVYRSDLTSAISLTSKGQPFGAITALLFIAFSQVVALLGEKKFRLCFIKSTIEGV